jgi:hypothetical protein
MLINLTEVGKGHTFSPSTNFPLAGLAATRRCPKRQPALFPVKRVHCRKEHPRNDFTEPFDLSNAMQL